MVAKIYEPDPWSQTRFNLVYSAVGSIGAIQIHFILKGEAKHLLDLLILL